VGDVYVRLDDLKADGSFDADLLRLAERMSRAVDDVCGRTFGAVVATRDYDGDGTTRLWVLDVLSAATVTVDQDDDGVYETPVASTDYVLFPNDGPPYLRLDLRATASLGAWPLGRRTVRITATWGYSYEVEDTGQAVQNAGGINATATSVQVAASSAISRGETIRIDDEQMTVSAVPDATHLTVVRGINGTTAASHAQSAAIHRRRYPRPIEQAVLMQVGRFWTEQKTGYGGMMGAPEIGGVTFRHLYPAIRDMLSPYRLLGVA